MEENIVINNVGRRVRAIYSTRNYSDAFVDRVLQLEFSFKYRASQ